MAGQNLHHLIKYQDYNIILLLERQIFNSANSQGLLVIFHHIKGIWCSSSNNNNNNNNNNNYNNNIIFFNNNNSLLTSYKKAAHKTSVKYS